MYQGQLCKIQVHENRDPAFSELIGKDGGWFLKFKGSDGKTKFHLVDQNRVSEMTIEPSMVDESQRNEDPTKPFYVVCVIPANIQPSVLSVSPKTDMLAAEVCIESKVGALQLSRKAALHNLECVQRKMQHHEEQVKILTKQIDELRKIQEMHEPYFLYAYGKHSADGQEFSWRVPYDLYEFVRAGSTVIADTKFGPSPVVVTKVEKSAYLLEHKLVISMG